MSRAATIALVVATALSCRGELRGAERELGEVSAGGAAFAVGATLDGEYLRERHGGGRFTYSCATDEERWTIEVSLAPTSEDVDLREMGSIQYESSDGEEAGETLQALTLETCPGRDDATAVFRIVGLEDHGWRTLHVGSGRAVTGAFESQATECAAAAEDAPTAAAFLTSTWHDAIRAWAELEAEREERPGVGASSELSARMRDGESACAELLALGAAEDGLRCALSLRILPESRDALPIAAAIREGESVEEALFSVATPDAAAFEGDAAVRAAFETKMGITARRYLAMAPTRERRIAYFDAHVDGCGEQPFPCPEWQLGALADIANFAAEAGRCDRMREIARRMLEDEEASNEVAETLLAEVDDDCGDSAPR